MLQILRNRKLIIDDDTEAIRILERENYYCLINGYKDLFLDSTMDKGEELYKEGANFTEIVALFKLDREIRQLLFPAIIKVESFAKTMLSYHFHKKFPEKNSFLAFENYNQDPGMTEKVLRVITTLSSSISQKNSAKSISHYFSNYKHCPLWVLVNHLTFGNISKTYQVCHHSVRLNIAKDISKHYKNCYQLSNVQISPEMLDECLGAMVMFRNVCAHDERLYKYRVKFKHKALGKLLGYHFKEHRNNRTFEIMVLLKLFLSKDEYQNLMRSYKALFEAYSYQFKTISISDIKDIVGYNTDWIKAATEY